MSTTHTDDAERVRRRQFVIDAKAASAMGVTMETLATAREAAIEQWTTMIHARMDECGWHASRSAQSARRVRRPRSLRVRKFKRCCERRSNELGPNKGAATLGR
jgi:hypothetical protein